MTVTSAQRIDEDPQHWVVVSLRISLVELVGHVFYQTIAYQHDDLFHCF